MAKNWAKAASDRKIMIFDVRGPTAAGYCVLVRSASRDLRWFAAVDQRYRRSLDLSPKGGFFSHLGVFGSRGLGWRKQGKKANVRLRTTGDRRMVRCFRRARVQSNQGMHVCTLLLGNARCDLPSTTLHVRIVNRVSVEARVSFNVTCSFCSPGAVVPEGRQFTLQRVSGTTCCFCVEVFVKL